MLFIHSNPFMLHFPPPKKCYTWRITYMFLEKIIVHSAHLFPFHALPQVAHQRRLRSSAMPCSSSC